MSEKTTVYAIDLLGFGASDKPPGFTYTMETWAEVNPFFCSYKFRHSTNNFLTNSYKFAKQLILDFLAEVVKKPTVLVGNSVGSLACVIAASGKQTMK